MGLTKQEIASLLKPISDNLAKLVNCPPTVENPMLLVLTEEEPWVSPLGARSLSISVVSGTATFEDADGNSSALVAGGY